MELNQNTYETYLLSYIDNQLSHSERLAVERFVKSDPKYAVALNDLQKVVLQPEPISYEDKALLYRLAEMNASLDLDFKKSLYRTEAASVVSMESAALDTSTLSLWNRNLFRYSAIAALFILTIGTAIKFIVNKDQAVILSATNSIAETKSVGIASVAQKLIANQPSQLLVANNNGSVKVKGNNNTQTFETPSKGIVNTIIASNTHTLVDTKNTLINNTTQVTEATETNEAVAGVDKEQINKDAEHLPVIQNASLAESFEEINTNESDRVIYISSIEIDSDKIRGFTRRINALFKRNKSDKQ